MNDEWKYNPMFSQKLSQNALINVQYKIGLYH